jgi:hypothetical protein
MKDIRKHGISIMMYNPYSIPVFRNITSYHRVLGAILIATATLHDTTVDSADMETLSPASIPAWSNSSMMAGK